VRVFWSMIVILVLVTAGIVIARRVSESAPRPLPAPALPSDAAPGAERDAPPDAPRQPDPAVVPPAVPDPIPEPEPAPQLEPAQPEPTPAPVTEPETPAPEPGPPSAPEPAPSPAPESTPLEVPGTATTPAATVTTPGAPKGTRPVASPEVLAAAEAAKAPPALDKQTDGTTLVDKRFVINGEGTQASPYEVTWEHLMSAQETYKPRLGLKVIPGRLNLLHDKWVKVSGYVAFPVMAQGPDEMLMMLNQWDGCCIGVPPTPYDAIEVKLATPAEGEIRLLVMGTITGKLKVDPYLVKDWLVSLYIMDEATVTKQSGAPLRDAVKTQEHLAP